MKTSMPDISPMVQLLEIMAQLRHPQHGCPWDLEQTFSSIAPYTIEEAYEVAEAIRAQDMPALREELGDLLLQVVFHAQIAEEAKAFSFADVATAIVDKMVKRHPHVFGSAEIIDSVAQTQSWERQKAEERAVKASVAGQKVSTLDGIALGLPALMRAVKLQNRAARVGFDWPNIEDVLAKFDEELAELRHEIAVVAPPTRLMDELGDLLFVVANLARHLKIDPEEALRHTNAKFERRFRYIEDQLASRGKTPEQSTLQEMDDLWKQAKISEHLK